MKILNKNNSKNVENPKQICKSFSYKENCLILFGEDSEDETIGNKNATKISKEYREKILSSKENIYRQRDKNLIKNQILSNKRKSCPYIRPKKDIKKNLSDAVTKIQKLLKENQSMDYKAINRKISLTSQQNEKKFTK